MINKLAQEILSMDAYFDIEMGTTRFIEIAIEAVKEKTDVDISNAISVEIDNDKELLLVELNIDMEKLDFDEIEKLNKNDIYTVLLGEDILEFVMGDLIVNKTDIAVVADRDSKEIIHICIKPETYSNALIRLI